MTAFDNDVVKRKVTVAEDNFIFCFVGAAYKSRCLNRVGGWSLGRIFLEPRSISMLLGAPGPRTTSKDLFSRDNFSIHFEDLLHPVDFPLLVELNGGFNVGVLLFGLIVRIIRI
jgi:hypothetical protein